MTCVKFLCNKQRYAFLIGNQLRIKNCDSRAIKAFQVFPFASYFLALNVRN